MVRIGVEDAAAQEDIDRAPPSLLGVAARGDRTLPQGPPRCAPGRRHGALSRPPLSAQRPRSRHGLDLVLDQHGLWIIGLDVGLAVEVRVHPHLVEGVLPLRPTIVATPLPIRLVSARASDMNRSTPRIRAMLATGTVPSEARVAASTMKPEPVTPAAPFEVSSRMRTRPSCWLSVSSVLVACARNTAAMVR